MLYGCSYTKLGLIALMGMVFYILVQKHICRITSSQIPLYRFVVSLCSRPSFKVICIDSDGSVKNKYGGERLQIANKSPILLQAKWKINLLIEQKNISFRKVFSKKSHYSLMSYDGTVKRNNKLNAPSKWKCTNMVSHQTTFTGLMHVPLYTVFVAYINCLSSRCH